LSTFPKHLGAALPDIGSGSALPFPEVDMNDTMHGFDFPGEQVATDVTVRGADELEVAKFLQVHEIGPVGTGLVYRNRQRDAEFDVVKLQFELGCVCAFKQVELHAAHPIFRDDDISRVLDLIQKALKYKEHDLLSIFERPSIAEFRSWMTRYSHNRVVAYYHSHTAGYACVDRDPDALVDTIAKNLIWDRVHRAYQAVFVRWMYRVVPEIDHLSNRYDILRAAHLVESRHHRFGCRFEVTLDHLRSWLGHRF
jgi:hypothetical protein